MAVEIHIHPHAVALARAAGISRDELGNLITEFQMECPTIQIGGYLSDAVIVAAYIAMKGEAYMHSEIVEHVVDTMNVFYDQ